MAFAAIMAAFMLLTGGCRPTGASVEASVNDAEETFATGDTAQCQKICTRLMAEDFDKLDEKQLGRLAIIFTRLSEIDNSDENMADATQCFRQAWKLSADSLRGFIGSLPPEDVPRFIMLSRIGGSIDFPPDLSQDHYPEDTARVQYQ